MTKVFPKSRICAIDCYPAFEKGLKQAISFTKNHNILLGSSDGKKIILGFCVKEIKSDYNSTKSQFPKVLFLSQKSISPKVNNFVNTHFEKIMKYLPLPYCGKHDSNSPDLEAAAEQALSYDKPNYKFKKYASRLNLRNVD